VEQATDPTKSADLAAVVMQVFNRPKKHQVSVFNLEFFNPI
jgi:hypothetical protein